MMFKGNKGVFIGLIVMIFSLIVVLIGMIINVDNERKMTMNTIDIIKEKKNNEDIIKLHNGIEIEVNNSSSNESYCGIVIEGDRDTDMNNKMIDLMMKGSIKYKSENFINEIFNKGELNYQIINGKIIIYIKTNNDIFIEAVDVFMSLLTSPLFLYEDDNEVIRYYKKLFKGLNIKAMIDSNVDKAKDIVIYNLKKFSKGRISAPEKDNITTGMIEFIEDDYRNIMQIEYNVEIKEYTSLQLIRYIYEENKDSNILALLMKNKMIKHGNISIEKKNTVQLILQLTEKGLHYNNKILSMINQFHEDIISSITKIILSYREYNRTTEKFIQRLYQMNSSSENNVNKISSILLSLIYKNSYITIIGNKVNKSKLFQYLSSNQTIHYNTPYQIPYDYISQ